MAAKKIGGGKLARSETVTVRLDPKLKYLAELAARKQRRTLSSYIEWVIEKSLEKIYIKKDGLDHCLAEWANELWDVDEADRFYLLTQNFPDLMTHEEEVMWKIIQEEDVFKDIEGRLMVEFVRSGWEPLKKYVSGEIDYEEFKASACPF